MEALGEASPERMTFYDTPKSESCPAGSVMEFFRGTREGLTFSPLHRAKPPNERRMIVALFYGSYFSDALRRNASFSVYLPNDVAPEFRTNCFERPTQTLFCCTAIPAQETTG